MPLDSHDFVDLGPRHHAAPVLGGSTTAPREGLLRKLQLAEYEASDYRRTARDLERRLKDEHTKRLELEEALKAAVADTHGIHPEFQRQGNFTICLLIDPLSERVFTGAACCNVQDTFNEDIGKAISFGRAAAARAEYYAENAYGK
ncbi:MAG: hypothetical protein ACXVHB_06105 [Solirubrobacteraceae bacterium]